MNPFEFQLDMTPTNGLSPMISCSQGDIKRPFVAELKYMGSDFTIPESSIVEIRAKKPDGNVYIHAATFSEQYVYFETEE